MNDFESVVGSIAIQEADSVLMIEWLATVMISAAVVRVMYQCWFKIWRKSQDGFFYQNYSLEPIDWSPNREWKHDSTISDSTSFFPYYTVGLDLYQHKMLLGSPLSYKLADWSPVNIIFFKKITKNYYHPKRHFSRSFFSSFSSVP